MNKKKVDIRSIKPGDTVIHNGEVKTVCPKDIKYNNGDITLFGDSYKCGYVSVTLVTYDK
jgi:hypothetical protein